MNGQGSSHFVTENCNLKEIQGGLMSPGMLLQASSVHKQVPSLLDRACNKPLSPYHHPAEEDVSYYNKMKREERYIGKAEGSCHKGD
jgi:hypothetical protein